MKRNNAFGFKRRFYAYKIERIKIVLLRPLFLDLSQSFGITIDEGKIELVRKICLNPNINLHRATVICSFYRMKYKWD